MAGGENRIKAGRGRGRRLLLAAVATLGLAGGIALVKLLWLPADPDQATIETTNQLAEPPSRPITVLLIGSDADRLGAANNGAAPSGPANSDVLLLARINPDGTLRLLNLPTDLAVQLPGAKGLQSLGSLYRQGGAALAGTAIAALLGLESGQPERYLVVPRGALRELVDGLGGVELNPETPLRSTDKTQNFTVDLQAGLQEFSGRQVEQMVRFKEPSLGEQGRRIRQQTVLQAMLQQISRAEQGSRLPELLVRLMPQLETNLSRGESLSLLTAAIRKPEAIRFDQLPLTPPTKPGQALRQLPAAAPLPLWPKP
ncbi:LCP family protein [Synechococcus sp. CS-1324]|uniref:LCP family protein n=1 Tax=Synechococcus sp. CS-1324 TaxID=2847980 RepID=UPI000DB82DE6|nr:LCP family protein [Synechococcus sp. CS-1324]MCT0229948.1 LCP family protein [Synechococcus sp. CS-1324]PZV02457.1 MAG: LytR family transcriptional regulator [Cyanobium sp.]